MTSFSDYMRLQSIIEDAAELGFDVVRARHYSNEQTALRPKGDSFPSFSREIEIAVFSSMTDIRSFISAIYFYKRYLNSIGITEKIITEKENKIRHRQLLKDIKGSNNER